MRCRNIIFSFLFGENMPQQRLSTPLTGANVLEHLQRDHLHIHHAFCFRDVPSIPTDEFINMNLTALFDVHKPKLDALVKLLKLDPFPLPPIENPVQIPWVSFVGRVPFTATEFFASTKYI